MSRPLTRAAMARGHEVVWFQKGATDMEMYAHAAKERTPILSFDRDFLNTAKFPLPGTPGRIVLHILPTIFEFQWERFEAFLQILPSLEIANKLIIVTNDEVLVLSE
jgi:hypothetical protein